MLWVLIAQTRDAILRARELEYAQYGISNERRAVLMIIQNYGGRATPVDIARDLFRELHSVTEMLARMEKDGLVTKHKGTGRSKVEVSLTEKGRDVFDQSIHNETDKKIFSALTKKPSASACGSTCGSSEAGRSSISASRNGISTSSRSRMRRKTSDLPGSLHRFCAALSMWGDLERGP